MVLRELLGLKNLYEAQSLGIYELPELIIIGEDNHFIIKPLQVVALSFKSLNNGWKLLIMSCFSSLYNDHVCGEQCPWVPLANLANSFGR